jgi:hypothetical protein
LVSFDFYLQNINLATLCFFNETLQALMACYDASPFIVKSKKEIYEVFFKILNLLVEDILKFVLWILYQYKYY